MSKILEGLNVAQRAAVEAYDKHSLIIAGAGSGKTRVLTSRIAYMLEQGVEPDRIMALTFTKKAANEMRERIEKMVGGASRRLMMGTFHSIFARLLRRDAELIGYPQNFTIYEPADQRSVIAAIIKERALNDDHYKPAAILSRISMAKNSLVTPGAYAANAALMEEDKRARRSEFASLYAEYCRRCRDNGAMDFDDLLLQTNVLMRDHAEVTKRYADHFRYILVDEYQDTNYAQYLIMRRLSMGQAKVCVVGDDSQSIYSFRGAKIENILNFQRDYPSAEVFRLEQNYRSTQTIVDAANSVIDHNHNRMKKQCFSKGEVGEPIRVVKCYTDREEADATANDIRRRARERGAEWSDFAILYRTNNQSNALETSLRSRGLPYRIYKGNSFFDRKEVRDVLGYLRLIINPKDDEAFKRSINTPARGIGTTTIERIEVLAKEAGVSMWECIARLAAEGDGGDAVRRAIIRKVEAFRTMISELAVLRSEKGLYDFVYAVLNRSGILASYREMHNAEGDSAVANIEEVLNSIRDFEERVGAEIRAGDRDENEQPTIEEWLEGVMLSTDMDMESEADDDGSQSKITLMTVHSAKGLEFKYVYIVGCEENLFPSLQAVESAESIEEERRLFYVALTRAMEAVVLSYAEMRFRWGNMEFAHPSRFLKEIDEKYLEGDIRAKVFNKAKIPDIAAKPQSRTAIEMLRERYDYRYRKLDEQQGQRGRQGASQGSSQGVSGRSYGSADGGRSAMEGRRLSAISQPSVTSGVTSGGSASGFTAGDYVSHPRFGRGVVLSVEPFGNDFKIAVDFAAYGEKSLIERVARLQKL